MVGIEGRYISIKRVQGKEEDGVTFQIDPSMDLALQVYSSLMHIFVSDDISNLFIYFFVIMFSLDGCFFIVVLVGWIFLLEFILLLAPLNSMCFTTLMLLR